MVTTLNQLQVKLNDAKFIHSQINELKGHKDFKSAAEVKELVSQAEAKLSKSKKVEAEIEKLKLNPAFLSPEEVSLCQKMVSATAELKLFLKKSV